jgi:hypothetical protein
MKVNVNPNVEANMSAAKMTDEQVAKAMQELEALKAKDAKARERTKSYGEKQRAKTRVLLRKAAEAGIEVTEEEIEEEMKKA